MMGRANPGLRIVKKSHPSYEVIAIVCGVGSGLKVDRPQVGPTKNILKGSLKIIPFSVLIVGAHCSINMRKKCLKFFTLFRYN